MMDYSNSADRWMARPHPGVMDDSASDLARHPLFGNGPTSGHLFADVTTTAHSAFNVGDFDACRRTTSYMDDDDGDDESVLPAPPSRAYTEAASSQSQQTQSTQMASQESTDSMNPARLRTDEVMGFWAHRVAPRPLLNPPTPQAQRTGFLRPEESPMSVVDGVVRAGLDTPSRYEAGTTPQRTRALAPPQYGGASYGAQSGGASDGNSSTSSNFVSVASDQSPSASPHNAGAAMTQGRLVSAGGQQYRTVQQYRSEQQLREQGGVRGSTAATQASRPQPHPRFDGVMSASGPIVIIEFKMDRRRRFRCAPELAPTILPDMWVVVQLENGGVDMGACVEVFNANDRHSIPKHYGHGEAGHVVRLADEDDCRVLNEVIPAKEEAALAKAHQLVHFLHMPFTCIDAEFQFDLKVVNLYYTLTPQAFTSIIPNVSRLQRELGFTLKAKVHLEQLVPVDQA